MASTVGKFFKRVAHFLDDVPVSLGPEVGKRKEYIFGVQSNFDQVKIIGAFLVNKGSVVNPEIFRQEAQDNITRGNPNFQHHYAGGMITDSYKLLSRVRDPERPSIELLTYQVNSWNNR